MTVKSIRALQSSKLPVALNPRNIIWLAVVIPPQAEGTIAANPKHRVVASMADGSIYTVAEEDSLEKAQEHLDGLTDIW